MSFEAERVCIETHFKNAWAAGAYASTPVIYDNIALKQPSTDFLFHRITESTGRQAELTGDGPALHRYVGLVMVDIMSPVGTGTATARKMADVVSSIYRRRTLVDGAGATLIFRTPSIRNMGTVVERNRLVISCAYQRDIAH